MSLIKEELLRQQEEEQELWLSYLEFVAENKALFEHLPKNIKDIIVEEEK